jgi:predicted HAD superfamily Cof-like phosphohydrolase
MAVIDYTEKVREFHRIHGHMVHEGRVEPNLGGGFGAALRLLRARLIAEEAAEAVIALHQEDPIGLADALADLLYVVHGTALAFGIPIEAVFEAVHAANLTKDGHDIHGKGGKGPGFQPPEPVIRRLLGFPDLPPVTLSALPNQVDGESTPVQGGLFPSR